jgi:acetoacetate decarboxylase
MKLEAIMDLPSMPDASPSHPPGPYLFVDREYLIITYGTDVDAIRDALPKPLQPDGSLPAKRIAWQCTTGHALLTSDKPIDGRRKHGAE